MKKISILIVVLLLISFSNFAQKAIKVSATSERFSVGNVDAFSVNIYEADKSFVEKSWKKAMKKYKAKVKVKSEIFADNALIKDMSDNTVDVYAKIIEEKEEGLKFVVAVDLGGIFLSKSSHSDKYKVFEDILRKFAVNVSKDAVLEKAKEEEKILDKIVKTENNLEKEKKNLQKDIEDYKKKIIKAEEDIKKNEEEQVATKEKIKAQEIVVKDIKKKAEAIK